MPSCPRLLYVLDLYDAAFRLWVLWILHHRHVQFVLVFAEGDIGRAISGSDFKDVEKFTVRRYLQNLAAKPLGNIDVTIVINLHAILYEPQRYFFVLCE